MSGAPEPLPSTLARSHERPSFVPGDDSMLDALVGGRPTPEDERKAARVVALHTTSTEECRDVLAMLGLTFDADSVGSYYTEPRRI